MHHLSPRVPNYRLESCYRANPEFQADATLTLLQAWRAIWLALWDEDRLKLVGFGELKRI